MPSHLDKSFTDTKDIIEPDVGPTKSQVEDVESTSQPDEDHSASFITSKLELWSFYLYYVGNNGLSGFNFGPSQFQNLLFLAGYDPVDPPFTTPCSANGCVLPYLGRVRDGTFTFDVDLPELMCIQCSQFDRLVDERYKFCYSGCGPVVHRCLGRLRTLEVRRALENYR